MDIELYEKIVSEIETPKKSDAFVNKWRNYMKLNHHHRHFPGLSQDFPCNTFREFINVVFEQNVSSARYDRKQGGASSSVCIAAWRGRLSDIKKALKWCLKDEKGRCKFKCANCNNRFLFNKLECVEAELKTTKETLKTTKESLEEKLEEATQTQDASYILLHEAYRALEEEKQQSNEDKRKFAGAIAKMIQSEMGDVRTQLTALNLCLKDELGEKAQSKKATSEAAKAALSASKFIKLRLLMF